MLEYLKYISICGLLARIALCQPVPENRLELASSGVHVVDVPEERDALIRLLDKARSYYTLKETRQAYHLKTSFTVTSGGRTEFDGDWQLDEMFSPSLGFRRPMIGSAVSGSVLPVSKVANRLIGP